MRTLPATLVALVAFGASSCIISIDRTGWTPPVQGSGLRASEVRAHAGFERVEASGAFELELEQGEPYEVIVSGDDNLVPLLETRVENGVLRLRTRRGYSTGLGLSVRVRCPRLAALELSGSHEAVVRGLQQERLALECSGSNVLRADGQVDLLEVALSGSSEVDLEQLVARDVRVSASGSSELAVHATERLDLSLSGSSEVRYRGAPRLAVSQSGSSSVRRSD